MRIALFTDSYLPTVDGVVTSVLTTRRQLEADGHEVVVFAPEDPRRREVREAGTIYVRAKEFRHYPGYRLAMFPGREVDMIKDMGIDLVHIHGVGFVGIKGLWASWQAKIPLLLAVRPQSPPARARAPLLPARVPSEDAGRRRPEPRDP